MSQLLLPIIDRLKTRFKIGRICIVADRGMISAATVTQLESTDNPTPYILGARMRQVKVIRDRVLSHRAGIEKYDRKAAIGTNRLL